MIEKREKQSASKDVVVLAVLASLAVITSAFLIYKDISRERIAVNEAKAEQDFIDSLHIFPEIDFADTLYEKVTREKYESDNPKIVYYVATDSLGNPTKEIVHETHYYENSHKYIDGNVKSEQREGLWYAYFPDGTVQTKAFYKDGKEEGRYTVYYSNGNVRYTGNFKSGKRVGEWRFYNEDGSLQNIQQF